jgi:hypothetical protein
MMYDPHAVLAAMDANKWAVIAFCGAAMLFNYTWFYQAVRQGFRDRVFPLPISNVLFWLCGDATGVSRFDMYFNQYGHWYLELFWCALVFTVSFEIFFIWMILKFGRDELTPGWSAGQFAALLASAAAIFLITWHMVLGAMPDDLNIVYFNIANMAGPIAMAGLILRRKSTAGTTSTIWINYTLMLVCFYIAQALWFGPAFQTPAMLAFMAINVAAAAALAVYIRGRERALRA